MFYFQFKKVDCAIKELRVKLKLLLKYNLLICVFLFTEDKDLVKNLPQKTKTKEFNIGLMKVTKGSEVNKLCVMNECRFSFKNSHKLFKWKKLITFTSYLFFRTKFKLSI